MSCREPALYVNEYTYRQRLFWAPFSSCFTKPLSSSLVLLSVMSPLQSPFKLCYLDHFPGSSSYFTCSAVLLFSLPFPPCSMSQMVLHHYLQLSSLPSNASFSHMIVYSCNHFHAFCHVVRCLRKPTKLRVYYYLKLFLKLACITILLNNAGWLRSGMPNYISICIQITAALSFYLYYPNSPFFPFYSCFLKLTQIIRCDLPFLQFMNSTLHNISFSNPRLASGSSMIHMILKIIDATLKKINNLEICILKNES